MNWILARLLEAATWAGFGVIALAIGTAFPSIAYYADGAAAIFGAIAGVLKEKGATS